MNIFLMIYFVVLVGLIVGYLLKKVGIKTVLALWIALGIIVLLLKLLDHLPLFLSFS